MTTKEQAVIVEVEVDVLAVRMDKGGLPVDFAGELVSSGKSRCDAQPALETGSFM